MRVMKNENGKIGLDSTLGVRNTDTSITYLVCDSRLYVTVRQL